MLGQAELATRSVGRTALSIVLAHFAECTFQLTHATSIMIGQSLRAVDAVA